MTLAEITQARQRAVWTGRQPAFTAVIDQAALHRMVGGPAVMCTQLLHLAQAADDTEHATVQVLPFTSGAYPASFAGPITILRFADPPGLGVVYLSRLALDGISLMDQSHLTRYTAAFTQLAEAALSPASSAELLRELAAIYGDAASQPARGQADFVPGHGADGRQPCA